MHSGYRVFGLSGGFDKFMSLKVNAILRHDSPLGSSGHPTTRHPSPGNAGAWEIGKCLTWAAPYGTDEFWRSLMSGTFDGGTGRLGLVQLRVTVQVWF